MLYNDIHLMKPQEMSLVKELNRFRQNKDAIFSSIKSLTDMDCTGILMSVSNLSKDALKDLNVLMDMQTCFSQGDINGVPVIRVLLYLNYVLWIKYLYILRIIVKFIYAVYFQIRYVQKSIKNFHG